MKKMLVIDGNSLLFRAFYATSFPGAPIMQTKEGIPTNAIFAFSNMINKIILDQGDEEFYIFVAFDTGHKTFRHNELETYKANRKPVPQELVQQMPLARELLKDMGVFVYEQDGVEGDDVAGSVAKKAAKEGYEVFVYTSDRDFLQLIEEHITINILKKGLKEILVMTPTTMKEMYGFEPLQIQDFKGLMGDTSDNLPGIPGVGEKTAVKLIQEYGSLEAIINAAPNMKSKLGEKIIANQELGKLCKHLAIIKTDIELPFTLEQTLYTGVDFDNLREFCLKYELKQLLSKIKSSNSQTETKTILREDVNFEVISNSKDINFGNSISLYLDLDTKVSYFKAEIYGLAFTTNNKTYYINIDDLKNDSKLKEVLADEQIYKIAYDYKMIRGALSRFGISLNGLKTDLMIATYLIDSSLGNSPESVANLFGFNLSSKKEDLGLFSNGNQTKASEFTYYAMKLEKNINDALVSNSVMDLYQKIEIPLVTVLSDMEIEGFPLHVDDLKEIGVVFKDKLKDLSSEIINMVGHEFNIDSPKQVATVLFDELHLPENKKRSTSIEVLNELIEDHPIIPLLISYRKYAKLVSTYIDGLTEYVYPDSKIHCIFNQALTTTGRLSSSEPNLQNISIRDEESKLIRKSFYYSEDNISILSLDYSQIELRLLAQCSNCNRLIEVFNNGKDVHADTARAVFNIKEDEEVPSYLRRKAKAVNFGIVYGISSWGLSNQIGVTPKEASNIINAFYSTYPEIGNFLRSTIEELEKNGYVKTMFGRKRYIREIFDSNYAVREFAKRAAMNAPIQGTAADLIKLAMIKVASEIKSHNLKSVLVSQIHDELIFKVYNDEIEELTAIVKDCMEHVVSLNVKLEVDGGVAKTWYDAK